MKIFSLGSNPGLARELAELLGDQALPVEKKVFPNQEIYVRLTEDVRSQDVWFVGTSYPNPQERLFELMLAVDAAKHAGAKSIKAVIPYMAYGRQDRIERQGEPVSAQAVIKALSSLGLDELYVADYHNPDIIPSLSVPTHNVMAAKALGEYVRNKYGLVDPVVVLPGTKSLNDRCLVRAKEAAEGAKAVWYTGFLKERDKITGEVTTKKRELGVKGKDVLLIDDEISTGSTVINAMKMLSEEEPNRIFVACTHGIFFNESLEKIRELGAHDVIASDSIPSSVSKLHLAPLFKEAIIRETTIVS